MTVIILLHALFSFLVGLYLGSFLTLLLYKKRQHPLTKNKKCLRCGHEWKPRSNDNPIACPKCKSTYWNRNKIGDKYEPKNS
jgi:predicted RNA-binding Zn-ribbon protein involved in translation (DUF1610 family)